MSVKIVDEALLDEFRTGGRCQFCGRLCVAREPHHLWPRGAGGWQRLDIRINLIALGSSQGFQCPCHHLIHTGKIKREDVLRVVARREGLSPAEIADRINEILWPKE